MNEQTPYIEKIVKTRAYNPEYGDTRICKCGHHYYRHFDGYEDDAPVGCKYCQCGTFVEAALGAEPVALTKMDLYYTSHLGICKVDGQTVGVLIPASYIEEMARELYRIGLDAQKNPDMVYAVERIKNFENILNEAHEAMPK